MDVRVLSLVVVLCACCLDVHASRRFEDDMDSLVYDMTPVVSSSPTPTGLGVSLWIRRDLTPGLFEVLLLGRYGRLQVGQWFRSRIDPDSSVDAREKI